MAVKTENSLFTGLGRVMLCLDTNVSEDHAASIFRVEVCSERKVDTNIGRVCRGIGINHLNRPSSVSTFRSPCILQELSCLQQNSGHESRRGLEAKTG
jgi:hypothetical protein